MYWRFEKYLIDEMVTFLRRVFRYNTQWTNTNLEIVQVASGSEQLVFEQFFEENERYPVITVTALGGNYSNAAFNDIFQSVGDDIVPFGDRSLGYATISDSLVLGVQVPEDAYGETLRGLWTTFAWSGNIVGGDDVQAVLYKNYTTTKVAVASASINGSNSQQYNSVFAEFYPYVALTDTDYWVEYQTASGSTYYMALDTDATTLYKYGGVTATGSINGSLVLPVYLRYGGHYEGSIQLRCMAKNDTATARNLGELSAQYVMLAKHAQLNRTSIAIDGMANDTLNSLIGEWFAKGFYIKGVHQGALENRRRGEHDLIFISAVTIDIFADWSQDYPAQSLRNIEIYPSTWSQEIV
jgi:hypothetical protein